MILKIIKVPQLTAVSSKFGKTDVSSVSSSSEWVFPNLLGWLICQVDNLSN